MAICFSNNEKTLALRQAFGNCCAQDDLPRDAPVILSGGEAGVEESYYFQSRRCYARRADKRFFTASSEELLREPASAPASFWATASSTPASVSMRLKKSYRS